MSGLDGADFLQWAEEQAALLARVARGEAVGEVDWANLSREVEQLGMAELRQVKACLHSALENLLNAAAWPDASQVPAWLREARMNLDEAAYRWTRSMAKRVDLRAIYAEALLSSQRPSGLEGPPEPVWATCPLTLDEVLGGEAPHLLSRLRRTHKRARVLQKRELADLLREASGRVIGREIGADVVVTVPAVRMGAEMLARLRCDMPIPDVSEYRTDTPWTGHFHGAVLHGSRGIVQVGSSVVVNTLPGPEAGGLHHTVSADGVTLNAGGQRHALPGRALSLISVKPDNHWHWLIDALGRLAAEPGIVGACQHVLVPPLVRASQWDMLEAIGIEASRVVQVRLGDSVACDELIVPMGIADEYRLHPDLVEWGRGIAARQAPGRPRRVYVDRRGGIRPLANEDEIIAALTPLGFEPIRLQDLTFREQVALFAQAECVVAPHGAGLANLIFAPPECRVLELLMNTYVHWCFRRLCAAGGMRYDCVIGAYSAGPSDNVNEQRWRVSTMHVRAAVEALLAA